MGWRTWCRRRRRSRRSPRSRPIRPRTWSCLCACAVASVVPRDERQLGPDQGVAAVRLTGRDAGKAAPGGSLGAGRVSVGDELTVLRVVEVLLEHVAPLGRLAVGV